MSDSEYRFSWYCSPCRERGEWHETHEGAVDGEREHIDGHDELLYEPTVIQRYPADEVPLR